MPGNILSFSFLHIPNSECEGDLEEIEYSATQWWVILFAGRTVVAEEKSN